MILSPSQGDGALVYPQHYVFQRPTVSSREEVRSAAWKSHRRAQCSALLAMVEGETAGVASGQSAQSLPTGNREAAALKVEALRFGKLHSVHSEGRLRPDPVNAGELTPGAQLSALTLNPGGRESRLARVTPGQLPNTLRRGGA